MFSFVTYHFTVEIFETGPPKTCTPVVEKSKVFSSIQKLIFLRQTKRKSYTLRII